MYEFPLPPPDKVLRTNGRFKFNFKCTYGCNSSANLYEGGQMVTKDAGGYYNLSDGEHNLEVRECFTSWLTGTLCMSSYVDIDVDPINNIRIVFFDSDATDVLENPDANDDCEEGQLTIEDSVEKICVNADDDGGELDTDTDDGYVWIGCEEDGVECFWRFTTNEMIEYSNNKPCGIASIIALGAAKISALVACPTYKEASAQNAFEHTAWQWRLANQCGAAFATTVGNAREAFDGNNAKNMKMDQFFNGRGRALHGLHGGSPVEPTIKTDVNANSSQVRYAPKTCP